MRRLLHIEFAYMANMLTSVVTLCIGYSANDENEPSTRSCDWKVDARKS